MSEIRIIDEKRQIVAECPLWDDEKNLLYTIDILGMTVRTTDLDSLAHSEIKYPQEIGCIALCADGGLIAAMRDGIYRLSPDGSISPVCLPKALKGRRFNDGKVGPDGRLYVGTTDAGHQGAFYRVDHDGTLTELFDHMGCSNGLAWSGDHRTMYLVDSPDRMIYGFDFDEARGELSNRRSLMEVPSAVGEPDGMAIDAEDKLWLAVWGGGAFFRIDPVTAAVIEKYEMPVSKVSCCAFAGNELSTLAITSASKDISPNAEPDAGKTFALKVQVKGRRTWRFGTYSQK